MKNQNVYLKLSIIFIASVIFFAGFNFAHAQVSEKELGEYLNQERKTHSLTKLNFDLKLYQAAQKKAQDMVANNYFEHFSPQGKSPWDFIIASGYDYKLAGENLAMDFANSKAINDAWMASYSHKENMLNPEYNDFAIAKLDGKVNGQDTTLVVEMFGKKDQSLSGKVNGLFTSVANYLLGYENLFK